MRIFCFTLNIVDVKNYKEVLDTKLFYVFPHGGYCSHCETDSSFSLADHSIQYVTDYKDGHVFLSQYDSQ